MQEILTALKHVHDIWQRIILLDADPRTREAVDAQTVSLLEGLAPASSTDELDTVCGLMHSKKIFPKLLDRTKRARLLDNISSIQCMIPTLHSTFEGIKQLEPACEVLKRSIAPSPKSIRLSLMDLYTAPVSRFHLQ